MQIKSTPRPFDKLDQVVSLVAALENPHREPIIRAIAEQGQATVTSLQEQTHMQPNQLYQHLAILRKQQFINRITINQETHYTLDKNRINQTTSCIAQFVSRAGL